MDWILTPQEIHFLKVAMAAARTNAAAAAMQSEAAAAGSGGVAFWTSWEGRLKRKKTDERQVAPRECAGSPMKNLPRDGGEGGGAAFRGRGQIHPQAQLSVGAENGAAVAFHLRWGRNEGG